MYIFVNKRFVVKSSSMIRSIKMNDVQHKQTNKVTYNSRKTLPCSRNFMLLRCHCVRGLVKLKKIQKSEKNSEVGGWVKHELGLSFFGNFVFLMFLCFQKKKKKWIWGWVGGVWPIRAFLGFWIFFTLTIPLRWCCYSSVVTTTVTKNSVSGIVELQKSKNFKNITSARPHPPLLLSNFFGNM